MPEAIMRMQAAMKEMEDKLVVNGEGEKVKDQIYEELRFGMLAIVEKMNILAGRMGIR